MQLICIGTDAYSIKLELRGKIIVLAAEHHVDLVDHEPSDHHRDPDLLSKPNLLNGDMPQNEYQVNSLN